MSFSSRFSHPLVSSILLLASVISLHGSPDRFAPQAPVDAAALRRANEILGTMSLEQKIRLTYGASTMSVGAMPEIGLHDEFTMTDGPHNIRYDLARYGFARDTKNTDVHSTSFPTLIALGATFNRSLADSFGYALGQEARDRGKDVVLGPNVNIHRSPIAGRNYENVGGEDPQLAAIMVAPIIRGMQRNQISAAIKHYALNNQESNRTKVNVEISERALREIYLPGFESAIKNGGSLGLMNAYNQVRGNYCSHNAYLNHQILRKEWGFHGFIVSDWGGMLDAVKGALGGTDIDMRGGRPGLYQKYLLEAVRQGKVPPSVIDDMARHVLYTLVKLNKFQPEKRPKGSRNTKAHKDLARSIAEEAIVLLRNDRQVLPLNPQTTKRLLVLGQNAVNEHIPGGFSAGGNPLYEITPLQGLQRRLGPQTEITYAPLQPPAKTYPPIASQYLLTSDRQSNVVGIDVKAWKTEYFKNRHAYAKTPDMKPDLIRYTPYPAFNERKDWKRLPQGTIPQDNFVIRWTAQIRAPKTGYYLFSLQADDIGRLSIDRKLVLDTGAGQHGHVATVAHHLLQGKTYEISVEMIEFGGGSKLSFGWQLPTDDYKTLDQIKALARQADAVLIFTGNTHYSPSATQESEYNDRKDILPPAAHNTIIPQLLPLNPKTVVINLSGAAVTFPWEKQAPTLVQYWFAGQEGGHALARVLFGDVNPSGKLPFTVPYQLKDVGAHAIPGAWSSVIEPYKEGIYVGYRWFNAKHIKPLFAFGHGLSYTTFALSKPRISKSVIRRGESVQVTVTVTNTGKVAGKEVVQFYVNDVKSSVDRPEIELKEFAKVFLKPGESQDVTVTLFPRDLSFWSEMKHGWVAEPGDFVVRMGTASDNLPQSVRFTLAE